MQNNAEILVNSRIMSDRQTGVHRYLSSILACIPDEISSISPETSLHGIHGHAWEQFVLPRHLAGRLLWSPCFTGPLSVKNQVVTVHDLVPFDHPESLNWRFAAWYRFLMPRLVKRVKHVIAVSEFTKKRLMQEFNLSEERITVIWNGVDARFQPAARHHASEAIAKLGIPSQRYVVALGSLEPRKNLKRLLQAWEKIVTNLPDDVWLVLAGAKGKKIIFDDVSFEPLPPRVYLAGYVDDQLLPSLYAGAIAAPYVSFYEGFGLPTVEAMACGTPVLTSNCSALPEVVGDAALTTDPYNTDAIAQALQQLLQDENLRKNLRARGLERAAHFNWQQAAEQTLSVLKMAATRHGHP
jgi:glycosyltransferase involved in cell wall biosynthesis